MATTEKEKALDVVRQMVADGQVSQEVAEKYFPELKESEDERISKEIIKYLEQSVPHHHHDEVLKSKEWIAWLEKQGEQKSIDNLTSQEAMDIAVAKCFNEQKFDDKVEPKDYNSIDPHFSKPIDKVEHLIPQKGTYYTCIKDYYSSDNTHLCVKGNIYKSFFNGYIDDESHLGLSWTNSCTEKYFEPTKDEDWIVCEHDNVIGKPMQYREFKKKVNQKFIENLKAQGLTPKLRLWTIQDAKDGDVLACESGWTCIFKTLVNDETFSSYCFMDNTKRFYETGSECHTLKEEFAKAYNGEIHPATKEQRDALMNAMTIAGYAFDFEKKELKKIEQKSAWSEEDEKMCQETIDWFEKKCFPYALESENPARESIKWLKSLKDRYTWKPSDEQIGVIEAVINNRSFQRRHLDSLYEQLKKLREE